MSKYRTRATLHFNMTRYSKTAAIFGGTGFIGEHIVRELADADIRIKVASRVPQRAYDLMPSGVVGQIVGTYCDYSDPASVARVIDGCDYVINCIGVLYEKRRGDFQHVHADIPRIIATACAERKKPPHLFHISASGIEACKSRYATTKREGETAIREIYPAATILRPSVVFGPKDDFFNRFARMAALSPCLPLIGNGDTRFQPVYVGDIANAIRRMIALPSGTALDPRGYIFNAAGPEIISFRDVLDLVEQYTGVKRGRIRLPYGIAKLQASILQLLPVPPLTPDQVTQLKTDSVASPDLPGLTDLGVTPTPMEAVLPTYLARYRPGGPYIKFRSTASA